MRDSSRTSYLVVLLITSASEEGCVGWGCIEKELVREKREEREGIRDFSPMYFASILQGKSGNGISRDLKKCNFLSNWFVSDTNFTVFKCS